MNQLKSPQVFVRRFDEVRSRMLQVQVARAAIRSLILLISGLALLAALDYAWEAPRVLRAIGFYGVLGGALAAALYWIVAAVRHANRPRTALEIEDHFPELGQSVRTAVQFGGRSDEAISADGVRSTLVDALEERVDAETGPLPIEAIVPTRRMKLALAVSVLLCAVLGALCINDASWNTAAHRVLLDERPYTEMAVTPGDTQIEQGSDLAVGIELSGRTGVPVTLFTRKTGDDSAAWQEQTVSEDEVKTSEQGLLRYEIPLTKIKEPIDYRVAAGKLASDEFHVTLKYPLRLEKVEVALTPPEYTRGETTTVTDGNVQALEGTSAVFRFELDRAPVAAKVLLADPRDRLKRDAEDIPAPEEVAVTIDGNVLTMQLDLTQDKVYSLTALSTDNMALPENSFRIRVRKDQPPNVSFDEPGEALEVHTLAEVFMRLRARDDFGLTKVGIVFQVNNEEEHTLLQHDFEEALAEAEKEAADGKRLPPTTQSVLPKVLPLEHFELTQKDSVTYYAFAEDNFPGGARRSESDLRFIDIRPFRRNYKLVDPDDGGMPMGGKPLPELDELIARERHLLNRTTQLARRAQHAQKSGSPMSQDDLSIVDNLIEFQQKVATLTHDLAEALQERNIAGNDLLFQAEEAMLAAVDSLTAGKYDNAVLQEKDALHYLIEGRNVLTIAILKKSQRTQAELRAFQRMQMQKLRKPKNEDDAEEVASRLRELADQEEFVYETLTGMKLDEDVPGSGGSSGSGKPKKSDKPAEPKDGAKDEAAEPKDGQKPAESENPQEAPGANGAKGAGQKGENAGQPDQADKAAADENPDDAKSDAAKRAELVQKQADIAAEAAELQKVVDKMKDLTDLAKSRMNESLKTAERAASSLERGDSKDAGEAAGKASGMFRELARNVEGLAAKETSQKIAVARNVAEELSQAERDFANAVDRQQQQSPGSGAESPEENDKRRGGEAKKPNDDEQKSPGSGGKGQEEQENGKGGRGKPSDDRKNRENGAGSGGDADDPQTDKLASRADRIAEAGKTLEDILKAISRSNEPADRDAAAQVRELITQGKLEEAVKRLAAQAPALRAGKARETSAEARDMADRFEATAQKLEGLHRSIVAPRIADLMKAEREAVELQEKLERLETQSQIGAWHRDADELIEQLEKLGLAEEPREQLEEVMKEAGWTADRLLGKWDWTLRGGHYGAPIGYYRSVREIVSDLHDIIQELILGDLRNSADETTPPNFDRLVNRYFQVLSSEK